MGNSRLSKAVIMIENFKSFYGNIGDLIFFKINRNYLIFVSLFASDLIRILETDLFSILFVWQFLAFNSENG